MSPTVSDAEDRRRVALFGASIRAAHFLEKLIALRPNDEIVVCSFREDPWEAKYFDQIKRIAKTGGASFHEIRSINAGKWEEITAGKEVDLLFAVGWRYIIPQSVYGQVRNAAITFHDSLLPKYRGFAPTNWAMINGENQTGATMFVMSDQVDAGPIVSQRSVSIGPDETISEVAGKVTGAYNELLEETIESLLNGSFVAEAQDETLATLTTKRTPDDGLIDWSDSSEKIHNLVRALASPWPGAFTYVEGRKLMIWTTSRYRGYPIAGSVPGRVVPVSKADPGVTIATGDGAIVVHTVQYEGDEPAEASDVIKSVTLTLGR